jgi:2-oxoglutarate ferredoxin oxidoreductase subunit alpha
VIDIQRSGPSTGMPTKTEQADLLQVLHGRNGECPLPVLAAKSPADCFETALESVRIAVKYMTPVVMLSDGYLANGAEPWRFPNVDDIPGIPIRFATDPATYQPYTRDPQTLARPWALPGTKGLEHRIGGLEKADQTGNVNYDPENHAKMVDLRAEKVARVAQDIPPTEVIGEPKGDLLIIGWGGTYGVITSTVENLLDNGFFVGQVHLRHLNPFPPDLGDILKRYRKVLVPELNLGQLRLLLRARYLVDAEGLNKVAGQPFKVEEILGKAVSMLAAMQSK